MKRSGPPKRRTPLGQGDRPLRANPEATKAFVERSRETARDRAREKPRTAWEAQALRGADPPTPEEARRREAREMREARATGVHPARARSKSELTMAMALMTPFVARRPAREETCARCSTPARPRRADHWHHWLPQQQIRAYVRGLRLSPESTRAMLRKLLRDERNLVALCAGCHLGHEQPGIDTGRRLTAEEVPHAARVFALELGPEWAERLRRLYRSRSDR